MRLVFETLVAVNVHGTRTAVLLLLASLSVARARAPPTPSAAQAPSKNAGDGQAAAGDSILGAWTEVNGMRGGQPDLDKSAKHVFTASYFSLDGMRFTYTLDDSVSPAHLDATLAKYTHRAIYRLDKDQLTICFPLHSDEPRPAAFDTGTNRNLRLFVLRRIPTVTSQSPEKSFDATLKSTLAEIVKTLEAGDVERCLKTYVPEQIQDKAKAKGTWDKQIKHFEDPELLEELLTTFRLLNKVQPNMPDANTAEFDLRKVYLQDGFEAWRSITFERSRGKWLMLDLGGFSKD